MRRCPALGPKLGTIAKLYACKMSSLAVTVLDGVHCHPLFPMSKMSLLPVVKVVGSVTLCGPSFTQCASSPPGGRASVVPEVENSAPQSVGKVVEESLTMFPSSSNAPAFPTSVSASAVLRNGIAIANVTRAMIMVACTYLFETIHFVLFEISVIVDIIFDCLS